MSIVSAVIITMIALGIEKPGKIVQATVETNLYNGFTSVTNIVFAFGMFLSKSASVHKH